MLRDQPNVRFLLVGDGALRPEIEASARELGIEKNVVFAGARTDVPRLMLGAMDVFLFPSLREGLGLSVVEAQAAGLPCLVSEVVPRDACVVAGAVSYASVGEGAVSWTRQLIALLGKGRVEHSVALNSVTQSEFNIDKSCSTLARLYSGSIQ